jgi:precorrin-6A synthase
MKKILIIGIGAGDPEQITIQAVKALNQADLFFVMEKGEDKARLIELRKEICRRYIDGDDYRFVDATSPEWSSRGPDYRAAVDGLNRDKRALFERMIAENLGDGECGAFLVWGDPSLYDSTIRIVGDIAADAPGTLEFEVIPGISSVQALVARHKTTLNRIGQSVAITTGRKLTEGFPEDSDSVVVMLDSHDAFQRLADRDIEIYWGAYVGMPEEILRAGTLKDVGDDIQRLRAEARLANGWIMDSYLLRRPHKSEPG